MSIKSTDLRQKFLSYFESKGHTVVASSPLVPAGDATLLFTNAGMVQFKDVFTGKEKKPYKRAASSQKCVRAGGKHNDLENVGRTARHHTFFEMLGNFSFGDYFKKDACQFAWEFLTKDLKIDPKRLSVTVFGGEKDLPADTEAEAIWRDVVGVPADQIRRCGMEDNFWAMGDTGPCGPCTEIHFDRGTVTSGFGDASEAAGDQNMEIWNLVFMQYERKADGSLIPLPAPCVDTGMGLERLCTVVNGLSSNYETDLLKPFIDLTAQKIAKSYKASESEDDISMRVIGDHCRTTAFLIADGVLPSNDGRGYVLRRIMRRAIRHGARLGFDKPFFHDICDHVVEIFAPVYRELGEARSLIQKVVLQEEESFRRTLDRGLVLFDEATGSLKKGDALNGALVFKLYETFGFPPDLTTVLAEERGFTIDSGQFETAKAAHEQASAGELGLSGVADIYKDLVATLGATQFVGDRESQASGKIVALLHNNISVKELTEGQDGGVLLDQTPFYGESGGQIGDTGELTSNQAKAHVQDTKKIADLHVHFVKIDKGHLRIGDSVTAAIDASRREKIRRHHSATHLLHAALRKVLGSHVTQKGSLVAPDRLRFDFSHFEPVTPEQLRKVEDLVNDWVLNNSETVAEVMAIDQAKNSGAMALFGEKYGDEVRVVKMGPNSTELCGGTHVHHTGDIGYFRITNEGPLAAGVRRLEAVSGQVAIELARKEHATLLKAAEFLMVAPAELPKRLQSVLQEFRAVQKQLDALLHQHSQAKAGEQAKVAKDVNGVKVITERMRDGVEAKAMQTYADQLRNHLGSGVVILGAKLADDKCSILVALTKDLTERYHAGKLVAQLAEMVGGKGGGRPDFAQAGGPNVAQLDEALKAAEQLL